DGALHLNVILLSAEMTARRQPAPAPMTLGQASRETRRAFIYSARVINHAIQTGSDPSWVLALVLAHEVGHMLLPVYSHTTSGLMRPYWEGRIAAIPDFLPSQAEEIRRDSQRRHHRTTMLLSLPCICHTALSLLPAIGTCISPSTFVGLKVAWFRCSHTNCNTRSKLRKTQRFATRSAWSSCSSGLPLHSVAPDRR